ncbi:hypothetical protein DMN91_005245 [Ooceraea biroi]|uniref:Uncharacterized protein n=1 Tax=Ooceraea biroi TaxID=2015173 RepID=A0A3L8DRD5_OOCBI|nr:collagen alpha-1(III) chain-like [Ooceraea biroi]RLU22967.1 hypothetical protein DMN91_005245 [Ooceraea biroi]
MLSFSISTSRIRMRVPVLILFAAVTAVTGENDESWAWNNDKQKESRSADPRYQVQEPPEYLGGFGNNGIQLGFRPQNPGPFGPNGRPIVPPYQGNNGVLVGPGGPTGIIGRPPRYEPDGPDGILGSVPPWIRDDPRYGREFDTCKCRYSFNCPSPGLKFGSCSRDKKYCCFNSKRFPGLLGGNRYPYYPGAPHKFGPNGFAPNYYGNRRPYGNPYGGHQHPSFGNYHPGSYGGSYGHRNEFEPLGPYGYDAELDDYVIYGRSLSKNQTQAIETPKIDEDAKKQ